MLENYKNSQTVAYSIIKNVIINNKISHAYLIETMGNNYGLDFAKAFAKILLCPNNFFNNVNCDNCSQCKAIDNNNFIELEIIDTNDLWIKKDNIDNLQKNFNFKPVIGKRKVYIINNVDRIRENVINKLLKFIEEPAEGIIAILVTDNKEKIIDTIISRCQLISLNSSYKINDENILLKYKKEYIESAIQFVEYYETNKIETIIYANELLHSKLTNRIDYVDYFDIIIMYYNDLINYKLYNELLIFKKYNINIKIIEKLSFDNIIKRIELLLKLKDNIMNNVNLNLLVDKLIISFERVK